MGCDISVGANRDKVCNNANGGNSELYLFKYIEDAFTIANGVATAINIALTVVYKYDIRGDGNTLSAPLIGDSLTGTSVCTQTLVAQLHQTDSTTGFELTKGAQGTLMAVLKNRNGVYSVIGEDDGFKTFTAEEVSGGAKADFNGYNLTAVAETKALPAKLDALTTTAFLALYTPTP